MDAMRFELQTQIGIGESTGKPRNRSFDKALKNPAPEAFLFQLKGGSEDHSYGGPQNPADATWLQNRRVTMLRYEKV